MTHAGCSGSLSTCGDQCWPWREAANGRADLDICMPPGPGRLLVGSSFPLREFHICRFAAPEPTALGPSFGSDDPGPVECSQAPMHLRICRFVVLRSHPWPTSTVCVGAHHHIRRISSRPRAAAQHLRSPYLLQNGVDTYLMCATTLGALVKGGVPTSAGFLGLPLTPGGCADLLWAWQQYRDLDRLDIWIDKRSILSAALQ